MNKNKKIAMAVISTVMAGAMLVPLAACGGGGDDGELQLPSRGARSTTIPTTSYNAAGTADAKGVMVDGQGNLVYPNTTVLNMNICDGSNKDRHISFDSSQISASAVLPDNYTYRAGDLKPAWWQLSQTLGVKFADKGMNRSSDKQITEMITNGEQAQYNIVTGSGTAITNNADQFLNLADYLEYMPNYNAYLEANPIVKWSLSSGMDETGVTGGMYYAPYFDGNNDIEKYVLTHKEWTRAMLDSADYSAATTTWAQSKEGKADLGTNQTYVQSFMGQTGSYTVKTTDPANKTSKTLVDVKVNYDAALAAAKDENKPLGAAIKEAKGAVYAGTSGNIIDIQNEVIGTTGAVTGAQLIKILREYIKVAYQKADGTSFYTTLSDVFNSEYAAWDVDLYVALSRCVVTSYKLFGGNIAAKATANQIYALAGRQGTTQRRTDLVSFVGELYGVRGLESRNEYTYIDHAGNLQDARTNSKTYEALNRLSALAKEGLLYTGTENANKVYSSTSTILTFSMHDYSQTQTTDGFFAQGIDGLSNANIIAEGDLKFDFAPIVTPVSQWDEDGSGAIEDDEYFRFTESWRATKNTGFCVPKASVENNPAALSATLAFIDYLFSNDGQIIATYGPQSTNGNKLTTLLGKEDPATGEEYTEEQLKEDAPNGFWYATEATSVNIDTVAEKKNGATQYSIKQEYEKDYFVFQGKVYTSDTTFGTKKIPTLTTNNLNYYLGLHVNGYYLGEGQTAEKGGTGFGYIGTPARNYTNYDRGIIGGALPLGIKDQGFEFQGTADCGLKGTNIVTVAKENGSIKHLTQQYSAETAWYTCVPTTLPLDSTAGSTLGNQTDLMGKDETPGLFLNTSKTKYRTNMFIDLLFYGYGASGKYLASNEDFGGIPADAAACIKAATDRGLTTRVSTYANGWTALKTYFLK